MYEERLTVLFKRKEMDKKGAFIIFLILIWILVIPSVRGY